MLNKVSKNAAVKLACPSYKTMGAVGLGIFIAITALSILGNAWSIALIVGSFGASCVVIFGFPETPFAQPRNVICSHLITASIGLLCIKTLGAHGWVAGLALALSTMMMMRLCVTHPPAGSNPIIIFLAHPTPSWSFLVFPILCGVILLVAIAWVYHNRVRRSQYPMYW